MGRRSQTFRFRPFFAVQYPKSDPEQRTVSKPSIGYDEGSLIKAHPTWRWTMDLQKHLIPLTMQKRKRGLRTAAHAASAIT